MSDFARWIVAFEMALVFMSMIAVVALYDVEARRAPRAWRWCIAGVMIVILGGTIAVVINALVGGPQTPGVKALAYIAGPAATLGIVAVVVALRRQPVTEAEHREAHVIANAPLLAEALSHLKHLDPCPTPECGVIRHQLRALAGEPAPDSPDEP